MEVQVLVPYRVGMNEEKEVLLDLGISTRYMVLRPEEAIQLAEWLIKYAKKALGQKDN
jgi:hypothetical protein